MDEKHDVSRKPSREATAPIPEPVIPISDIPDGGLVAWLQVAGSALLFFNSW